MIQNKASGSFLRLVGITWRYVGWRFVLLVAAATFGSVFELLGIAMFLPIFNMVSANKIGEDAFSQTIAGAFDVLGVASNLQALLALAVLAFITKAVFVFLAGATEIWTTTTIRRDLQINLAKLIENARFGYHYAERTGNNTNLLSRECDRFTSTVRNLARGAMTAVTGIVFISVIVMLNFKLFLVIGAACTALIIVLRPLIKWTREYSGQTTDSYASAQSSLLELVQNFVYLKATNGTKSIQYNIESRINRLAFIQQRIGLITKAMTILKEPVGVIALSGIIYYQVVVEGHPIGEVVVLGLLFYRLVQQILDIQNNWQRVNSSIGGIYAVEDGINRLEEEQESDNGEIEADLSQPIILDNLSAVYGDFPALSNINLTIKPFETVGIVGPSGAGKSSLFHIITSLLDPASGSILLGDTDYGEISKQSLRSKIGYVTQDPALFHATLAENIAFWRCDPMDPSCWDKIETAATRAGCQDLLNRAHDLIGEQGKQLSGGQRQRVAIARELFKDPPLLVFDEATSALDSQSEAAIQESIHAMHGQRTILIIAHRLSTVMDCDRIVVLDGGRIVQQGSFNELLHERKGLFRAMCERQGINIDAVSPDGGNLGKKI